MKRKIIGLDETGAFERKDSELRLIGGFVKLSEDPAEEEKRLEGFFRDLCQKINEKMGWVDSEYELVYPYSLHMAAANIFAKRQEDGSLAEMNRDSRGWVKARYTTSRPTVQRIIQEAALGYMKVSGYRLYALVDQPAESGGQGQSNLLDFEVGGNRYERLAILSLYNNIFYDLEPEPVNQIDLHLATRSLFVGAGQEERAETAELLYDRQGTSSSGDQFFSNTNTSTFKTALADKLYECGHLVGPMDFAFHVDSANYKQMNQACQPFLYLADIACMYLRQLFLEGSPASAKESSVLPISIWVYGEADRRWRRALEQYQAGNLSECFAQLYEMKQGRGPVYDYYCKYWAEELEQKVLADLMESGEAGRARRRAAFARMPVFLSEIEEDMRSSRRERGFYLAGRMKEILHSMMKREPRYAAEGKRFLFLVNDQLLRGLNYRGAVAGMREYIDECDRYRSSVQIEEYLYHIIRVLQYYFNSYQFERAAEVASLLEETAEKMAAAYQEYARAGAAISGEILGSGGQRRGRETVRFLAAGRLHSTLGQAYAFLGKYGPAKRYFAQAEQEFGDGENRRITLCHEMQLYLDQKKQTEYERASREYFGTENLWEQWETVAGALPESCYALQAYVKAFRVFYAADRSNDYLVEAMVSQLAGKPGRKGHPWQIIYKNLYEILCLTGKDMWIGQGTETGQEAEAREQKEEASARTWLRERMCAGGRQEPCMEVMTAYYGILAARAEKGDVGEAIRKLTEIVRKHELEGSFAGLMERDPETEKRAICSYLAKKIRYEYV